MKLSILATLALAAGAIAQGGGGSGGGGGGEKKLSVGDTCTSDGKMGTCETGFCQVEEDKNQGTCQPKN